MHLSTLEITGYKLFNEEFSIRLESGLTVLVGENGTGKSAIIDAIRLLLLEDEYGRSGISASEFHRPISKPAKAKGSEKILVKGIFDMLESQEQVAYLPWLDINDVTKASLSLNIENKEDQRGRFQRTIWGGDSVSGIFEWPLLEAINCIYLPPLRDAENKLRAFRGSRLARLLKNLNKADLVEDKLHPLEEKFNTFNDTLLEDDAIKIANKSIRDNLMEAIGTRFGQDVLIQFSEVNFDRIVERLRLLFYPSVPIPGRDNKREFYREIEENSLGFNNILYLATVLAELEGLDSTLTFLKVLLIEEPEAHLHPQLQIRLLQYLEQKAKTKGIQVIITTHSPTIAASVELQAIKVLTILDTGKNPTFTNLSDCGLSQESKLFVERWFDITKSILLFAKGIILVEGIAEALVIPELAKIVFRQMNTAARNTEFLGTLRDYGVSVINLGGIYFKHFVQLFKGYIINPDGSKTDQDSIPVRCACITDCDPDITAKPTSAQICDCKNPQHYLIQELNDNSNCRMFSNLKTFEYDLAMEDNNLQIMSKIYLKAINTDGRNRQIAAQYMQIDWRAKDATEKAETAFWLLDHIESKGEFAQLLASELSSNENTEFQVPIYIKNAIFWAIKHDE